MKLIWLGLVAGAAMVTSSVYAVTKCVKLTAGTTCTADTFVDAGQSDWTATCGGVLISGIGFCSSQDGGTTGAASNVLTTSLDEADNRYCWCRMLSPAVSRWVFYLDFEFPGRCAYYCARNCAGNAAGTAVFRTALFSGMTD